MRSSLRLLLVLVLSTRVIAGRIARGASEVELLNIPYPTENLPTPQPISLPKCYSLTEAADRCSSLLGPAGVLHMCEQHYSNGTHDEEALNINDFNEIWRNESIGRSRANMDLPHRRLFSPPVTSDEDGETTVAPFEESDVQQDWREGLTTVTQLSRELLNNEKLADYTFIVGNEKQEIKAHSIFLARASPFFESLFREETQRRVLVPDVTSAAFKVLLDYAYTGEVCLEDFSMACELVGVSARMGLPELRQRCLEYLENQLYPGNVWKALRCASTVNDFNMKNLALKMVETDTEESLSDPAFAEISHDTLMTFLRKDSLNVKSELQVLDASLRWAMSEAARRSMTPDPEALRSVLGPALGLIRFLTLTPSEFANMQSTAKLLNYSESLAVIFNLNSPGVTPLPPNISPNKTPRKSEIIAVGSYFNIRGVASTKLSYSCSKPRYHYSNKGDAPKFPVFQTGSIVQVKGIKIPSQVCSLLESTYKEDLTVKVVHKSYGNVIVSSYRYTETVPCNSALIIKFPHYAVLQPNGRYTIDITFHKSGKYPKVYEHRSSINWPAGRNLENDGYCYFYEYAGEFLDAVITDTNSALYNN